MGDQAKKKILIVDDAEVNQMLLSRILEAYELVNAYNWDDAVEKLHAHGGSFDLIILDLIFPDPEKTGLDLLEYIKADDTLKDIPVIVMSAQVHLEKRAMELGAVEFWKKPFWNAQEVQNRVAKVLG